MKGGLGEASCPQGGDIPNDQWKGGTQGGGGGLDTFPPVPLSIGLGESPQNSGKREETETEIESELRKAEREERIERKKRKEYEWKRKREKQGGVAEITALVTEEIPKELGREPISEDKEGGRGTTGGDHSLIKRGAQEVPAKGGEVKKSDTDRQEKIKFSPGIEKMRRIFETEEKIEKESKQERKSRVEDIRNTFEMLMDPQKLEREAEEDKERERKRVERQKNRE